MEPWTAIEFVASSPSNQRPEFTYGHVLPEMDVVISARSATFCVVGVKGTCGSVCVCAFQRRVEGE